jgi:DNA-binding transcriptional LysR family regulator
MFVLANAMLPRLIPELRRCIPGIDLDFAELSASTREARLLDRSVTVALCMPAINHPEIQVARIGAQPFMLAVPNRSPLARLSAVPMIRLQGRPLIALPPPERDPSSSAVAALLRRHQIVMPIASRVQTVHSAMSLVLAGEGLAILPACAQLGAPRGVVVPAVARCKRFHRHRGLLAARLPDSADPHFPEMRREGGRAAVRRASPLPLLGLLRYWLLRLKTSREKVWVATGSGQDCDCRPRRAAQAAIAAHFLMLNAMEASRICPLAFMRPT